LRPVSDAWGLLIVRQHQQIDVAQTVEGLLGREAAAQVDGSDAPDPAETTHTKANGQSVQGAIEPDKWRKLSAHSNALQDVLQIMVSHGAVFHLPDLPLWRECAIVPSLAAPGKAADPTNFPVAMFASLADS
jgi:hypothetical protein